MRGRVVALVVAAILVAAAAACTGDDDGGAPAAEVDCAPARPASPGTAARTLVHDGESRAYTLSIPDGYDGSEAVPVILSFHGLGSTAAAQDQTTALSSVGASRGYIVVTPQALPIRLALARAFGRAAFWNIFGTGKVAFREPVPPDAQDASSLGANDVGFVEELLRVLGAELCVDADRIYGTGHSNGAGMATTLGCELDDRFAAIGAVAGVNLTGVCVGEGAMSVLAIHGDADNIVNYDGGRLLGFEVGNPSVPERMAAWARRSECAAEPVEDRPQPGLTVTRWPDCSDDVDVELWTISGWGHGWPRASSPEAPGVIDATDAVLDFFDTHTG